jgi:transposase
MANVLKDEKKQQIIALGRLGWSLRKIQEATRVRRETISAYLRGAGVEIWPPGRWKREGKAKPAIQVITGSEAAKPAIPRFAGPLNPNPENLPTKGKASATSKPAIAVITGFGVGLSGKEPENSKVVGSASTCEPYREIIELSLSRDRNAMAIWQDLVSDYGFRGGYQSVRRFAYKLRGAQVPPARAVILTAPGEEGQVDYGSGPMVREAKSGQYRRTRLFVLTLGYSRKAVRLLVFRSSTRIWAELHEKAFRRLGGAPRILVLDNLREGVLVPDVYDATLNPLYRDVLAHYGAVALPCRIQDPDRKGKVERSVGHAKNTPLKGKRFESLEEGQAYLDRWETNWGDTRIHGTTKRQVAAMFAEEKPTLGSKSNGMSSTFVSSIPILDYSCENMYVRNGAGTAFSPRTTRSELPSVWCSCSAVPAEWAPMSVHFATLSIASRAKWACGASWAFSRSPKSTAPLPSMKLARQPWRWGCTNIVSCGATLSVVRKPRSVCARSTP